MLTLTHAWSRTQKVLLVGAAILAIGAFVVFAYSYERSHRLPDESILFGTWQMTAPHDDYVLGLHDIVGLWDGVRRDHWHSGSWAHSDPAKQIEGYSEMGWYAGGSYIYMRINDESLPQIWQIVDIRPEELRLRHAKQDYVFRRISDE
jgi:hypothetical protein